MLAGKDLSMLDAFTISLTGICMVFLELLILALAIILISKIVGLFTKSEKDKSSDSSPNTAKQSLLGTPLPETQSAGTIDLVNVSEEDAAIIMAIVSKQSGIPLNKLSFESIKLLEDKEK